MRKLIVANWKMNTTLSEAIILANGVKEGIASLSGLDVVLCPPSPWLVPVAETLRHHPIKHLMVGAQNVFWGEMGAYTGETAASMLIGVVDYVIIGHSERRRIFHEDDGEVAAKVKAVLAANLKPIVCVGELRRPTADVPTPVQLRQPLSELEAVLDKLTTVEQEKLSIAYEPVWAISTNKNSRSASGLYANAVAEAIHELLPDAVPILYGGSVTADNGVEFLSQPAINGVLVGGASLKVHEFVKICRAAM